MDLEERQEIENYWKKMKSETPHSVEEIERLLLFDKALKSAMDIYILGIPENVDSRLDKQCRILITEFKRTHKKIMKAIRNLKNLYD